jgi:hypothetical protein
LLTERVAAAAAQNATSQLTRFAVSGGRVNFNKQAFYSAIATAAASAAIEFKFIPRGKPRGINFNEI